MIGGDFDVPIMYQDLAKSTMGPMNIPFGAMSGAYGGMATPSYLGGVRMRQQPDQDKLQLLNKKENEDKSTLKKAMIALAVIVAAGSIAPLRKSIKKAGGFKKYVKSGWQSLKNSISGKTKQKPKSSGNWFTRLFKKKSTP